MKKKILVYGSTEFGAVVRELVRHSGAHFAGFVDDWHAGEGIIGTLADIIQTCPPDEYDFAIAIGYKHLEARRCKFDELIAHGYSLPSFIHPQAYVSDSTTIGAGVLVMARAVLDIRAQVGDLAVVWPGAVINHDCVVDGNTFISPNATLCGHSRVGIHTFIGAGAVVVDHTSVPSGSFIKAGSVFVRKQASN
jgi:sugar O-acyltransferase (sialic acid O-acetyltransferase NeuD family)